MRVTSASCPVPPGLTQASQALPPGRYLAIMAFTTLASHAKVAQGPTSYREESDNMIHELYVW